MRGPTFDGETQQERTARMERQVVRMVILHGLLSGHHEVVRGTAISSIDHLVSRVDALADAFLDTEKKRA